MLSSGRPRILFMGTPEIAVPALRLLAAQSDLRGVITQPDRPAGRGNRLTPPPIKRAAEELGLPVWQPESLKGQAGDARFADLDHIIVMAYGALLRQDVLDRPRRGCINLHASLLPRWRGASPLQAALRAGDARTGVSVMRMVRGLDAGPVYLAEEFALTPETTLPDLHDAMAVAAATALGRFLALPDDAVPVAQTEALVTYCRKLTREDGRLDFRASAVELERHVRAYTPAPGCSAMAFNAAGQQSDLRILVLAPRAVTGLAPGAVQVSNGELLVGCNAQCPEAVALLHVQAAGSRAMTTREFLNGHAPPVRFALEDVCAGDVRTAGSTPR